MENRKLQPHEIAGYIPHGLKIKCWITKADAIMGLYKSFSGESWDLWAVVNNPDEEDQTSNCHFDDVTPLLYPISHLHDDSKGEPLIVKLAKLVYPGRDCYKMVKDDVGGVDVECNYDNVPAIFSETYCVSKHITVIEFDFFHRHLIDYRGLIDAGLAIDVTTLEINPYE